jgi:glycosyltransferase involved in cell wall biosynthesis
MLPRVKAYFRYKLIFLINYLTSIDFFSIPIVFWKLPLILEIHATSNIIIQWSHFIKKPFYKLYSKVVFLNEIEEYIFNFSNSVVIPNFVSNELEIDLEKKKKLIISGGRNDVIKQWHHQIEAWNKIFHLLYDWEFHLYIDGEIHELDGYRGKVDPHCENLKIFKASEQFKKHLQEASIMVLSSKVECFSMNILEAFSYRTVVVSYATSSGPLTLIDDHINGVLVEQNNINDLAEAILRVAKDCQLRIDLAQKAKLISSSYSEEKIMKRWVSLFNSLCNEGT